MRQQLKITNYHGQTLNNLPRQRNRNPVKKAYVKITAIMLCWKGKSAVEISESLDIDIHTVSKYIRAFNEGGLEQLLAYKKAPGRPSKLSEPEQELYKEMFCLSPAELDFGIRALCKPLLKTNLVKN
jgi:hypothetical protein